jgi:HK97 family phage major capsid protein
MRNITEIRKDLKAQIDSIRQMDPKADKAAYDAAVEKAMELTRELENANKVELAEQRLADRQLADLEKDAQRSFSIVKFIREAAEGKLSGLEKEVAEMGAKEYERLGLSKKGFVLPAAALRSSAGQNAGTNADGGYAKAEQLPRYIDGLKDRLAVAKLGATVLGDLIGTVPVVSAGAMTAAWYAEGATASVSKAAFAKVTLTPHRNAIVGAFSKDLLRQTSIDIEKIVWDKIQEAHARLLEAACINGSGSSNQPTGILTALAAVTNTPNIVATGTNGGAITWANIVALETKINAGNANRGKLGYLTNAKVIGDMKTIERTSTNGRYLLDGNFDKVNGYPIEWTNLVPSNLTKGDTTSACSAMIFGNWEDLYIGHWGGIDIVVDPYTLAANGDVRIVLNSWDDCKVVETASFAAIVDLTTNA